MAHLSFYLVLMAMLSTTSSAASNCTAEERSSAHSRQKRLLFMSSDRRLTLPPSTVLILTPTLSLPFGRNLPTGYGSSLTISIPFKINFDDLGLTSEENPFGIFPDFFFRRKREADLPGISWAGGDREMMYQIVEDSLHNFGMDGQACLLRAICEMFQAPLVNHGFVGEVLEMFLSVSRSPHAEKRLGEYLTAERIGRSTGDCSGYNLMCPQSLFTSPQAIKNTEEFMDHYAKREEDDEARIISDYGLKKEGKLASKNKIKSRKQRKRCTQQYS